MTTDQDIIDKADEIIRQTAPECATGHRRHLAQALADAGLLAPTCDRECEALRDWDALQARLDQAIAERNMAVGKVDEMRQRMTSFADAWSGAQATLDRVRDGLDRMVLDYRYTGEPTSSQWQGAADYIRAILDGEDS